MNVQKLTVLLEALRCGSITKAAEEMGYTQSGLTYAINSLENELGFPLLIRDTGGIHLSKEGREMLPGIEEMVACERRLVEKAKAILNRRGRVLSVCAYPSVSSALLPGILADFNRDEPDVKVNIMVGSRDELINWLLDGTADFAIGGQVKLAGFDWMPLLRDPELAILPEDFPTEGMEAFPMEDFHKHPFIRPVYWADEAEMERQIEAYGIEPQFIVESPDNAPVIVMVEQGIGVSAIPKLTIPSYAVKIKTLPLEPPCSRVLGVNYRQGCMDDPCAMRFLKHLKSYGRENL